MEMPRPTEHHDKLKRLVGTWTGTETMYPSPWDPNGGEADAKVDNRLALDGFNVVQDYEQSRGGQVTFKGHGVMGYDVHRGVHYMLWFDSMGTPPNEFTGGFEGDSFHLANENPAGKSRSTFDLSGPEDTYSFKMEFCPHGGEWAPLMEGSYRKQG